ncbi:hypothetical protein E6O75_ATG02446 [Venturia nashicola]|uniref:Uncharacterized protein n=1 Tax=Venturia nashicola TaxID=86259 RepID=A0A4Z1PFG9_9PEZI|nr:hypothetical protein E6O75_ATG02446 [Venturia nashicola]
MPPTESNLLTSFLLPPSPLPTILPLPKFTALFPPSLHSSPSIPTLYADLHSQRTTTITDIRKNILSESSRGSLHLHHLRKARKPHNTHNTHNPLTEQENGEQEHIQGKETHTLATLPPSLSTAIKSIQSEISLLEKELAQVIGEIRVTVGDLSDLRYGRFTKTPGASTELREEVLEAIGRVREGALGVGEGR